MNTKQATASLAIVGMALLATITTVSPTQALDDVEFHKCLDELGDSPTDGEEEQVLYCAELGYHVQEDRDTPNEGADEDDDTNVG